MNRKRHTLVWTMPAQEDLLSIVHFIKKDNPHAARIFGKEIKDRAKRLLYFPFSGRMVPEFAIFELREIIVGNYRIIYRVLTRKRRVEVLSVVHGARDLPDGTPARETDSLE